MADLSAVLRKTIDGLPSATPQLRAKVYEKARAAVQRQIASADPPFADEVVDARRHALEEAIAATEAHYAGASPEPAEHDAPQSAVAPPVAERRPEPVFVERAPEPSVQRRTEPQPPARPPFVSEPDKAAPFVDRPQETFERETPRRDSDADAPAQPPAQGDAEPWLAPRTRTPVTALAAPEVEERVGEIGPLSEPPERGAPMPLGSGADHARDDSIDDTYGSGAFAGAASGRAMSYRPQPRRSRRSLYVGVASLAFVALAGGFAYVYSDELRGALTGTEIAAVDPTPTVPTAPEGEAVEGTPPSGDVAAVPTPDDGAPASASANTRQFTQRLQADGSEVDAGAAQEAANAFDEGTDIASATLVQPGENPPAATAPGATPPAAAAIEAPPAEATAAVVPPPAADGTVPVGQRAVFYEERSATEAGSQHGGNVVWSVVNEPPAAGQPAEPAIRAVADVPEENLKLTMTIRRNADDTLPASHVIELLFDVPADFAGGEIANVQRLALKPTEQARGEPLIGVAGRISDGFFIIALNDLQQAVQSNLTLMGAEEWIDIPLAYSSGQRALMSLEKGLPGERVFKEAMDAWAART